MPRRKQASHGDSKDPIVVVAESVAHRAEDAKDHGSSIFQLIICVGGIYASLYTPFVELEV